MKIPISDILKDSITKEYLRECLLCKRDVLQLNLPYVIEKAIKRFPELEVEQTIFEYCMCRECHMKGYNELSKESRDSVKQYFLDRQRQVSNRLEESFDMENLETLFDRCLISDTPKTELQEYQLYAHCQGTDVRLEQGAFMMSGLVIAELAELLSKKTRDHLDDFMDNNFGLPPELREKLKGNPILAF